MTPNASHRLYTRQFFQVFVAAILFMTGLALQFHFGQYIEYRGYGVNTLGRILSITMIGTLAIRLQLGRWIDRFGCRPTWLIGTLIVTVSVGAIQFTDDLRLITLLRTISAMASAAVMTTVAVFAAMIAPPHRRAESIGTIGLAGFLGMMAGPTLGDWIFATTTDSISSYRLFFSASALCSLLAGCVIYRIALPTAADASTSTEETLIASSPGPRQRHSQLRIMVDHWPGIILLIGVVFSMSFCLQSSFLERLAEERGFKDIKLFFLTYGPVAITLRIVFRRMPERLGRSRTLVLGMILLAAGQLSLLDIQTQEQLFLPGLLMGAGHSFIFPSMVDLAAERLPFALRGTGTSLILGAGDVGMLIGYVVLGELIEAFGFDTALGVLAATVLATAMIFAFTRRDRILTFSRK